MRYNTFSIFLQYVDNTHAICIPYVFNIWNIAFDISSTCPQYVWSMLIMRYNTISICLQYVINTPATYFQKECSMPSLCLQPILKAYWRHIEVNNFNISPIYLQSGGLTLAAVQYYIERILKRLEAYWRHIGTYWTYIG